MDLGPDDVGYVCMPLFHSNAVQVGWAPSLVTPCAVGLGRRFSASRLAARHPPLRLDVLQLHRQAARVPARAARAAPTTPTTRCASRSATRAHPRSSTTFARRFGVEVIDAYGATEGGVAVNRDADSRAGALGLAPDHVQVVDDDGNEKAARESRRRAAACSTPRSASARSSTRRAPVRSRATTTTTRRPRRRRASAGTGPATSATRTPTATSTSPAATPTGSASTARTSPPARSRRRCASAPDVVLAAVYGVPDDQAGDQVMAGLVLADGATFDPDAFAQLARRAGRDRAEVAPALRAHPARPADDRHEQDREAHARARRSSAPTSSTATRCTCATAASRRYRPLHRRRRARRCTQSFVHYRRERFWDL